MKEIILINNILFENKKQKFKLKESVKIVLKFLTAESQYF